MKITNTSDLSKTVLFYALQSISEHGNRMPSRTVIAKVSEILKKNNPPQWVYESVRKKGFSQWQSCLHYCSISTVKWGWLVKKDGFWHLTEDGQKQMKKAQTVSAFLDVYKRKSRAEYKKSQTDQGNTGVGAKGAAADDGNVFPSNPAVAEKELDIEAKKSEAREEIDAFLKKMDGHTFQCLVAALLRGMGYYVSFEAPRNTGDGGIDIMAYKELAGLALKVEVKHQKGKISSRVIRGLEGALGPQDIGVVVSTGGFVRDLDKKCRESKGNRVELIDLDRFLDLWRKHYHKMSEKDQAMMHMERIYFLTGKGASDDTEK